MISHKKLTSIAGWIVFGIAMIVYFLTAERTGSLWDCGEFILGAYKMQVVHPPGAPLFILVGRLFTFVADTLSSNPADIAFSINLMSGMFTAFAAAFVAWTTMVFTRLALVGRNAKPDQTDSIVCAISGLVAGLATAFCTSIWFSAVEGEVYAMSTFFTAMTVWAMVKWYGLPDNPQNDRWIAFAIYSAGLSMGVHLLSLLAFPALAILYYFKVYKKHNARGFIIAAAIGGVVVLIAQRVVIVGIPTLWSKLELVMVNGLGLPFHSGLIPTFLILGALFFFSLRYAHRKGNGRLQQAIVAVGLLAVSYSTIGVVVIRANAAPPINMNDPSDIMRLIPYLNREQYGERPLLRGPHFDSKPVSTEKKDRYGRVGDRYEVVDHRVSYVYPDNEKMLLPRIGHSDQNRAVLHRQWMGDKTRKPDMAYNLSFLFRYQIGWMYWRYFMWNFAGRQNGEQGFNTWTKKSGHWLSGIPFLDSARLYNQSELPETMRTHAARNKYFLLPLIFGIIGFLWQIRRRQKDWLALLTLFLITGLGIIFYSNQPPNEPRERDYVLVGSFFTFCIWIGMAVPALFHFISQKVSADKRLLAVAMGAVVLTAPLIMGFQNFDDHTRRHHTASRDYASNFLESCDPNAIIFTYGDNDTYPLWYAQEVENIRPDVRVVNLSLIAVDWYINGQRRKINDSPAIKFSIPAEAYRGDARNTLFPFQNVESEMRLDQALKIMGENHPVSAGGQSFPSYLPSKNLYIPIDPARARNAGLLTASDTTGVVQRIPIKMTKDYITKDELAILDIIMSNIYDRPIYFSVTCKENKLMGIQDYTQLEGLGLRIIPVKTPSNRSFFIYGSGRVDVDKVYDRVMNKWRWGNFDKRKMFVDNSYGASLQAQKMIIWRTTAELIKRGDKERAIALTDKFFEAFPHMNFPYDARTLVHIDFYRQAQAFDKAKEHLRILGPQLLDYMEFYDSLTQDELNAGFKADQQLANSGVQQVLSLSRQLKDTDFQKEIEGMLGKYSAQPLQN